MLISEVQKRRDIEMIYCEIRKDYPFESTSVEKIREIHAACIKAYEENPLNFVDENVKIARSFLKEPVYK
jgi:hypothetical protein